MTSPRPTALAAETFRHYQSRLQMLETGQRLELEIVDIAFGGEGVARYGEFVVFVPFVIVGEKVEGEIVEVKKKFARARLLRVLQASDKRVTPGCQYFGDCGGEIRTSGRTRQTGRNKVENHG